MKVEVRPSPIHGKGVFATGTIRKGERIGMYLSRRTERDDTYVLWLQRDGQWRGYDGFGRLRFINHSNVPNSRFRDLFLYAIRTIRTGEEITIHYGEDWADTN